MDINQAFHRGEFQLRSASVKVLFRLGIIPLSTPIQCPDHERDDEQIDQKE
jgi:hypothetical protein